MAGNTINPNPHITYPLSDTEITLAQSNAIGQAIGIDWAQVDQEEFREGLESELEYAHRKGIRSLTQAAMFEVARFALSHLQERADYYSTHIRIDTEVFGQPGG